MKKTIIILILAIFFLFSFRQEKKYAFVFTETQLNALWNCVDNSNAPHSQVKQVEELIQAQLKGQVQQATDSTKLKK